MGRSDPRHADVIPEDPPGQELPDASTEIADGAAAPVTDGDAPASAAGARFSPTASAAGAPTASAARGSQNTVRTPITVSKINVAVTMVEVRSRRAAALPEVFALAFGVAAIGRSIKHIMTAKTFGILAAFGAGWLAFGAAPVAARTAAPKFYFRLGEVKAGPDVDEALKAYAGEAVKADLAGRSEWASDVGTTDPDALVAELKKRNLRGFSVVVRFEHLKKEVKEPSPGARRKRVALNVKLSVFGTTIPEEKLSFSGDGESGVEAEVSDKGMVPETQELAKDAIKDAVKQAVDQAVMKLSVGTSAPLNEGKHKKKK